MHLNGSDLLWPICAADLRRFDPPAHSTWKVDSSKSRRIPMNPEVPCQGCN